MGGRPWSVFLWDQSKLDGIDFIPQQLLLLSTDESFYILFYKKKEEITTLLCVNDYFYRKEMIMAIKTVLRISLMISLSSCLTLIDLLPAHLKNYFKEFSVNRKKFGLKR